MLTTMLFEVTVPAQSLEVVHVESDGHVSDVGWLKVYDVMHLGCRSSTVLAQVMVTNHNCVTNFIPFLGFIKTFRELSSHTNHRWGEGMDIVHSLSSGGIQNKIIL